LFIKKVVVVVAEVGGEVEWIQVLLLEDYSEGVAEVEAEGPEAEVEAEGPEVEAEAKAEGEEQEEQEEQEEIHVVFVFVVEVYFQQCPLH
jgi:hypothetical protein